jgi:hypothetical protein
MLKKSDIELDGRISILWNSRDKNIKIEIEDADANTLLARVKLDAETFCEATLANLASIKCLIDVGDINKIGKKMMMDELRFNLPDTASYGNMREIAEKLAIEKCPEGWEPDLYFGSKDSFSYTKDGKTVAKCIIRKWVDK